MGGSAELPRAVVGEEQNRNLQDGVREILENIPEMVDEEGKPSKIANRTLLKVLKLQLPFMNLGPRVRPAPIFWLYRGDVLFCAREIWI